jgi:hypothetical protein
MGTAEAYGFARDMVSAIATTVRARGRIVTLSMRCQTP